MVETVLARLGFSELFSVAIAEEDVMRHEPDPGSYLLALDRLNVSAKDAIIFEDSNAGLMAARAARGKCLGNSSSI